MKSTKGCDKMATKVHKVFVSYHHENDQKYRNDFEELFHDDYQIFISKSVQIGDIDPNLKTDTVRQKIRNEYLSDSTVTVVLIGLETWKRKHIDWEISSSLRHTESNPRSGLIGILLPTHPSYNQKTCDPHTIPPRLYDNQKNGFAKIYDWSTKPISVQNMIHEAFIRRFEIIPDNSRDLYKNNRNGNKW